jgi:hypothetical protein
MFGYLMEGEIKAIDNVLKNARHPFTAIIGGSKVSSKLAVLENMLEKVDNLIIGGGMGYTFIKAEGGKIGNSLHEDDLIPQAQEIMAKAKDARQINRIFERMGYPAPVKEENPSKKAKSRDPSENGFKERGTGARASTEPTMTEEARPSVKSKLAALQAAGSGNNIARTKEPIKTGQSKSLPTR